MSRFTILKSALVISFGAIAGYTTVDYFNHKSSPNRYLASMTMSKMASEQFSKTLIDMRLTNVEIGATENDVSTIKVSLLAYKPIPPGLTFAWSLPSDVKVVNNEPTRGTLTEFAANQTQEIILKVKGYNKLKKSYISFSLNGDVENTKFQREILISSRPEDSFEYVVQQYERTKANDAKVNGKVGKADYTGPIDIKKVIH